MVRLRNAVMAVALGTGAMGCAFSQSNVAHYSIWHCDECDDFPAPAYGPGFSMMPGTYTGPPAQDSLESNKPANAAPAAGSVPLPQQPQGPATPPATPTLPLPPAAAPGQGADARQPAAGATGLPSTSAIHAESDLPHLPAATRNDPPVPIADRSGGLSFP
jgi:hypothetical protein